MIPTRDPAGDWTDREDEELDSRLVTDLQIAYRHPPRLEAVDAAVRHAVEASAAQRTATPQRAGRHWWRPRLGVPMVGLVLLSLGLGTYLHGQSPTPVSAQTILRRAAKAGLAPNQVTHFVYQITSSTGFSGTSQFWVQADPNGAPSGLASYATGPFSIGIVRHLFFAYEGYVGQNHPASLDSGEVTGHETLDGVPVDVVKDSAGNILYFDAQSYVLRGVDWFPNQDGASSRSSWHARLLQYGTVPASAVPSGAWRSHRALSPSASQSP